MTVPNGAIIIDSGTGSNTAASGLGPATAISGTGASLNATSTVDLSADTPDLSGVSAGDLLWVDTSSGRQFSIIASVNDGADTVTCDDAFGVTESGRNWGIGGKRASLGSSSRLFTNDNKGGWIIELASGHSETIGSTLTGQGGDTTNGPVILRGESGAGTKPIITFSNNGDGLVTDDYMEIRDFTLKNSNATKTASYAINSSGASYVVILGMTIADATDYFYRAIFASSINKIIECEIANTANDGIYSTVGGASVLYCYVHDCGNTGINVTNSAGSASSGYAVIGSILDSNGSHGLDITDAGGLSSIHAYVTVHSNIFYNNTDNGINIANSLRGIDSSSFVGNIFEANGGYGIDCNGMTTEELKAVACKFRRNAFYNNTSGKYLPTGLNSESESVLSAGAFVDAANGDFNLNNTANGGATLRAVTFDMPG